MSLGVVLVMDSWIFLVHTLCAKTATTSGTWKTLFTFYFLIWLSRCIAENETECPLCAPGHGVIRGNRLKNEKLSHQHDLFVSNVQEKGFEAVATAFSRGLSMSRLDEAA